MKSVPVLASFILALLGGAFLSLAPAEIPGSAPSARSDERRSAQNPAARSVLTTVAVLFLATGVCSFFLVRKRGAKG